MELSCPFDLSAMNKQKAALSAILSLPECESILSSPADRLNESQILIIYASIEDFYRKSGHAHARNSFTAATSFLRRCKQKIQGNKVISEIVYRTSLPKTRKKIKLIMSNIAEPSANSQMLAAPLTVPTTDKGENVEKLAIRHLEGRLQNLQDKLVEYIKVALEFREEVITKKKSGFPPGLAYLDEESLRAGSTHTYKSFQKYDSDTRLHSLCWISERDKLHLSSGVTGISLLDHQKLKVLNIHQGWGVAQWLLIDRYLTKEIITGLGVILSIHCVCNPSIIFGINFSQIIEIKNGYKLTGLKTKTDQLDDYLIVTSSEYDLLNENQKLHKYPVRFAIDLLLKNYASLQDFLDYGGSRIFVTPEAHSGGKLEITAVKPTETLKKLCVKIGHQKITISNLRPQIASLVHLQNKKNIYYVMAILGHSNITATTDYLRNGILAILNERNINRFILMLEQSIYFAVGREDEMDNSLGSEFIGSAKNLLFPVSDFSDEPENCLASAWLKSMGNSKITIDDAAVFLCSSTLKYYKNHAEEISSRDPKRFLQSHVGLILICVALHKIISTSPLKPRLAYYDNFDA